MVTLARCCLGARSRGATLSMNYRRPKPLERKAAAFKSCHSWQQMVARVPSATITMQEEDWKDFHFQMHTCGSCSNIPLLVSFLGPTAQHTVLLTRRLGVASIALYFLTFCDPYAQKYPCINRYFFFLFLWVMLCITMY